MSGWIDVPSSDELSKEQLDIYGYDLNKNLLINGAAGSGKTILAVLRAKQLADKNNKVLFIVFTNMLYQFTKLAAKSFNLSNKVHVVMLQDLTQEVMGSRLFMQNIDDSVIEKLAERFSYDHVVIDEGQDFPMWMYRKCFSRLGSRFTVCIDPKQSIYDTDFNKDELIGLYGGMIEKSLDFTYRNPVKILKLSVDYYMSRYRYAPVAQNMKIKVYNKQQGRIRYIHTNDEVKTIKDIIDNRGQDTVGVLLPRQKASGYIAQGLQELGLREIEYYTSRSASSINFENEDPKIMTFWSAKGLQFDTVVIPFLSNSYGSGNVFSKGENEMRAIYVAFTRARKNLYFIAEQNHTFPYEDDLNMEYVEETGKEEKIVNPGEIFDW